MRIEYQIDVNKRRIRCQAEGGFHLFAFANYLERVMHDPRFQAGYDTLIVVKDEATVPGAKTQAAIANIFTVWAERRRGARWAFVFPNKESRNKAMQVQEYLNITAVKIAFFTSEAEACAWLDSDLPASGAPL